MSVKVHCPICGKDSLADTNEQADRIRQWHRCKPKDDVMRARIEAHRIYQQIELEPEEVTRARLEAHGKPD